MMDFVVDIVEAQEGITFVTGYLSVAISVEYEFNVLNVYQPAKKKKHKPKKLDSQPVRYSVHTLLYEGEPLDEIAGDKTAQIGLIGDVEPLIVLLELHQWHQSNGRYFLPRNETRLISLSGA